MKVVLDTNVIISGLFWKGTPSKILDFAKKKAFQICLTPKLLQEIGRVLNYKKLIIPLLLAAKRPNEIINSLEQIAILLPDCKIPKVIKEDPTDNIILGSALAHRADFIVGDRHLLKLKKFQDIPIITPTQFLKRIT